MVRRLRDECTINPALRVSLRALERGGVAALRAPTRPSAANFRRRGKDQLFAVAFARSALRVPHVPAFGVRRSVRVASARSAVVSHSP